MTDELKKLAREIVDQFCEPTELEIKIAVAAMKSQRERDAAIVAAYTPSERWTNETNISVGETVRNELEDAIRNQT